MFPAGFFPRLRRGQNDTTKLMKKTLNFIIRNSVYGLVLLIPLFFLPWTVEQFEFNKQYLLFFLVSLAFLAWLAKMIVCRKEINFKTTPLDLWLLVFAIVLILSAVFSQDRISSWLGSYGRFSDSVIGLLCLLALYFILTNNLVFNGDADSFFDNWMRLLRRFALRNDKRNSPSTRSARSGNNNNAARSGNNNNAARSGNNITARSGNNNGKAGICLGTILGLMVLSFWIAMLAAYLSVFGVWQKISWLPEIMKARSFNPASISLEGLAIFLVFAVSFITGVILKKGLLDPSTPRRLAGRSGNNITARSGNKIGFIFNYAGLVLAMFFLVLIDFKAAWWILASAMFVFLAIALWTRLFRKRVNVLLLPIVIFIISALWLSGLPQKSTTVNEILAPIQSQLPQELILDYKTDFSVVWQTFRDNPILGSGPATYSVDFVRYKPASFNENRFWNVRFDRAPSHWTEIFATLGGLGVLSYLAIIIFFFLLMFILFNRKRLADLLKRDSLAEGRHPVRIIPIFMGWLALFIGQIFYFQNTALSFFFWVFTALTVAGWYWVQGKQMKEISFSFNKLPEVGLVLNVVLMLLFAAFAGLFYSGARFYWADVKFGQTADNLEQLVQNVEKAVVLNKNRENYRRALSQVYLNSVWLEARKPQGEQDINSIQLFASGALQQARLATDLSPNSIGAWENLGAIYRDSSGLVSGALPFSVDAFSRAMELEPANPINFRELCRLNLINGEEEKDWDKIMGYCQRAVDLKPNYLDAHIQLALAYEQKGEIQEAIKRAESVLEKLKGVSFQRGSDLASAASEIYFQLGRLYFNLKNAERAIGFFEQAVLVAPEYANARYALALSYQSKGRNSEALEQLKIVDQLVPGNETVGNMIGELEE